MTPPDPAEGKLREARDEAERWITYEMHEGMGNFTVAKLVLEAAGVPALLADTQSKDKLIAELVGALDTVRAYCVENRGYCRPPELATAPTEEVDAKRGPCAAYGAVVYENVIGVLDRALAGTGVASDGGEDGE